MTSSESTNVFVSYSHADASLVAPVVKLLRVNKSLVFQDIDDIQPGKRWRSEIAKTLDATPLPPELGEFQWIDFRGTVGANHTAIDSSDNDAKTGAPSPRSAVPVT